MHILWSGLQIQGSSGCVVIRDVTHKQFLCGNCKRDKMSEILVCSITQPIGLSCERLLWSCCWTYGKDNDFLFTGGPEILAEFKVAQRRLDILCSTLRFLNKSLQHHRFGSLEESDEHRVRWKHRTLPGSCNHFVFIVVSVDFKHCASYDFSSSIS